MTKTTDKGKISRRNLAAGLAGTAICAAAVATKGECATGEGDAELRRLFAEWEPLAARSAAANTEYFRAYNAWEKGMATLSPRAAAGLRVAQISESAIKRSGPPSFCEGMETLQGLKIPTGYFGPDDDPLAVNIRHLHLKGLIREDETVEEFFRSVDADVLEKERHDAALKERLQVDALDEVCLSTAAEEGVVVDAIAAAPAQGLEGLIIKAKVWEGVSGSFDLFHALMNDMRRLGGLDAMPLRKFLEFSGV